MEKNGGIKCPDCNSFTVAHIGKVYEDDGRTSSDQELVKEASEKVTTFKDRYVCEDCERVFLFD